MVQQVMHEGGRNCGRHEEEEEEAGVDAAHKEV
jgi:hypothetical protein